MGIEANLQDDRKIRTAEEENYFIKTALSQLNINVFVYDILSKSIEFLDNNIYPLGNLNRVSTLEEILTSEVIHPDYLEKIKEIFDKVHSGETLVAGIVQVYFLSEWTWQSIVMRSCFDHNSNTTKIVGTIQDVTKRIKSEQKYDHEQRFRQAMFATHRVYEVNLTTNRFMKLESMQDETDSGTWSVYTVAIDNLRNKLVLPEDWDVFSSVSNRENLLIGFNNGHTEFSCEYRTRSEDGELIWSSSTTHLLKDPLTGDIKGFIYAEDIDAQKKQELYLREQAEKDPLTGIYNRATAEKLITEILTYTDPEKIYALLAIDVDNFKQVNDNFGHVIGDNLLRKISDKFKRIVRSNDIFARMGGDEFIIFINGVKHISDVIDVTERLCNYVKDIPVEERGANTSLSIGIAIAPFDGDSFAELYQNSDVALYRVKDAGKNNISMFSKIACDN